MKKEKKIKQENKIEDDLKFLDAKGKEVKLKKVVSEKETWLLEKRGQPVKTRIISNKGVQKIAREAGIRTQYEVKESENIIPKPENSMLHIVEVTIECMAADKKNPQGCFHDPYDKKLTMTGEASRQNTGRGKDYLRSMAEKRGYDRAVLRHLGMDGVYSEEEASAFEADEDKKKVENNKPEDFEQIAPMINLLLNAKDKKELANAVATIKSNSTSYNPAQLQYLRELYAKRNSEVNKEF